MLYIKPIQGHLTHQTNLLLSMDPYCIIIFNNKQYKTSPHYSGGNRPKWSQTFSFQVLSLDKIKVEAWSRSVISSDSKIGKGELDLRKMRLIPGSAMQGKQCSYAEYVELFFEGKPAGKILLELAFTVVKKKTIFDQKARTSMPDLKELREKEKSKQKEKEKSKQELNGFMFSFANPVQNQTSKQEENKQQQTKNPQSQKNLQQKIPPPQHTSHQQIPSQIQQTPSMLRGSDINSKPSHPIKPIPMHPQQQQLQQQQQQKLLQQQQQIQQQNMVKPNNNVPGLPHNRINGPQRPVSPTINNLIKIQQIVQKYNPIGNTNQAQTQNNFNQPKQLTQQQQPTNVGNTYSHPSQRIERQNKMAASDKLERVGIGKTPPKSILSPGKGKREKSNRKVTFQS